mmetsp:Transcript_88351/g.248877  ORF Transcript_88351/g.248877 Transcript_88351/m.248877 type:complete len:208 (-) Transcript_88351:1260-1883(-)
MHQFLPMRRHRRPLSSAWLRALLPNAGHPAQDDAEAMTSASKHHLLWLRRQSRVWPHRVDVAGQLDARVRPEEASRQSLCVLGDLEDLHRAIAPAAHQQRGRGTPRGRGSPGAETVPAKVVNNSVMGRGAHRVEFACAQVVHAQLADSSTSCHSRRQQHPRRREAEPVRATLASDDLPQKPVGKLARLAFITLVVGRQHLHRRLRGP